ncbi:MAG: DNA polymerase III subunit delta' [Gammaproteobacteria bacterium HGW-Gammaproteobacteria-1]|jgi:DNA polymerase-3 subunit delta'|nr:MAG: DNA polymerase III subunit delta' [Gammaproteobacteria bacterium HGW-Gammaproteobacteria-1]
MSLPYPWQQAQWQAMRQRIAAGRLPHALQLGGPAGVGKLHFARLLAHALLCEQPAADTGLPCGGCRGCQLLAAGNHPDFRLVQPEEEGKEITIGQIRDLLTWQALTPQYGRSRIVIIEPADRMNANASNALLKTLEEPGRDALLLLVTARPAALLPTIRSRCQQLPFSAQPGADALAWLEQKLGNASRAALALAVSGGAPLRALALAGEGGMERREQLFAGFEALLEQQQEPVALAAQWLALPLQETLATLHGWHVDMARIKVAAPDVALDNPDLQERLQALAERVDLAELVRRQERLLETLRLARGHPNAQLLLEELLLGWSGGSGKAPRRAATTR